MYIFAYICLLLALLGAVFGGAYSLLRLWQGGEGANLARKTSLFTALCLALAAAILLHALFWRDYRLEYVASYTDNILPVFYRLTAFWAGQPGSMLFWALCVGLCGPLFAFCGGYSQMGERARLWFWAFFYLNIAIFGLLLTSWCNPFIIALPAPPDGNGLNPLLQNPGMIFHPPLLFMGYAGLAIPACAALAWACAGAPEKPWYLITRPFLLVSWLLLSGGIILGGWWAYMELGWGGYWGWDPVENASLLPWLFATGALHLAAVGRSGGGMSKMGVLFMGLTLLCAWFATWLTRSGVIQSVHAFGDGGVGLPLAWLMLGLLLAIILGALCAPKRGADLPPLDSRQGILTLTAWTFAAIALLIATATMWPVISPLWGEQAQGLAAPFYNRACLPLFAFLLFLLVGCPWLAPARGMASLPSKRPLLGAFGAATAAGLVCWFMGYHKPLPLFVDAFAIAIVCNAIFLFANAGTRKNPRALAAVCAHLGIAIMALGAAFSGAYSEDADLTLARGQTRTFAGYAITLRGLDSGRGNGYDWLRADLVVERDGAQVAILAPERRMYDKYGDMQFSEVDVHGAPGGDIYASLLGLDGDLKALVRISLEPLVGLIWIGGWILCLLPLIGLFPLRPKQ